MRIIQKDSQVVAYIFDGEFAAGTNGITDPALPLQVISLNYSKGKVWPLHRHEPNPRNTSFLLEALVIIRGKVNILLYHKNNLIEKVILTSGMGMLILDGAMQMEALEDVVMMEFKNGPFIDDKVLLDQV